MQRDVKNRKKYVSQSAKQNKDIIMKQKQESKKQYFEASVLQ